MLWVLSAALAAGIACDIRLAATSLALSFIMYWRVPSGRAQRITFVIAIVAFCAYGNSARRAAETRVGAFQAEWAEADTLRLTGWVSGYPSPAWGRTSFEFTAAIRGDAVPILVRSPGFIFQYGDSLSLAVRRARVRDRRPETYWLGRGVVGAVYVVPGHAKRMRGSGGRWINRRVLWPLHNRARQSLARGLGAHAGLPIALLIGERSQLDRSVVAAVRRLGIAHLFALSGLHLGLVAGLAVFAVRWLPRGRLGVVIGLLAAYVGVVGPLVSLERSFLMALWLAGARLVRRRVNPMNGLACALLLILLFRPLALYSVAFQLSFAATFAVVAWAQSLPHSAILSVRQRVGYWVGTTLWISTLVQVSLIPLLITYFGAVSVVAPVATLLFLLPVAGVLFLSAVSVLSCAAIEPLCPAVWWVLYAATRWLTRALLAASAGVPDPVEIPQPVPVLFYGGLVALWWAPRKRTWYRLGGLTLVIGSFALG